MLTNLDEIVFNVKNKQSKKYLEEAIKCYRVGAYRSSINTIWLAICIDIIEKVKDLKTSGSKEAVEVYNKIENLKKNNNIDATLQFENELLKIAEKKLQILSPSEVNELKTIKEKRNICSHPNIQDEFLFEPYPEMVRLFIVQASNYLFIQQPAQGKYIIDIIKELIESDSFPINKEKAFLVLEDKKYLQHPKDSVYKNIIIDLCKLLFKNNGSVNSINKYIHTLLFIKKKYIRFDEVLLKHIEKEKFHDNNIIEKIIYLLSFYLNLFDDMSEAQQEQIIAKIEKLNTDQFLELNVICLAKYNDRINKIIESHIEKKFNEFEMRASQFKSFFEADSSLFLVTQAIKNLVYRSVSYKVSLTNIKIVNVVFSKLTNNDVSPKLTNNDLGEILDAIINNTHNKTYNQILEADHIDEELKELYKNTQSLSKHRELWNKFKQHIESKYIESEYSESSRTKFPQFYEYYDACEK